MNLKLHASFIVAALLGCSGAALAQTGSADGTAAAQGQGNAATQPAGISVGASGTATTGASADVSALRQEVMERASKLASRARAKADASMEAAAHKVDAAAENQGEQKIEARLAAVFGISQQALAEEHQSLDASWGNLMIAHTLSSNLKSELSVTQLMELKQEGMGWGQIAAGLGLNLGSCVSGVNAENRVATGLATADGQAAAIHGEGARATR